MFKIDLFTKLRCCYIKCLNAVFKKKNENQLFENCTFCFILYEPSRANYDNCEYICTILNIS